MIPSMDNPYAFDPAAGATIMTDTYRDLYTEEALQVTSYPDAALADDQPTVCFRILGWQADDPSSCTADDLFHVRVVDGPEYEDRLIRAAEAFTEKLWEFHRPVYTGWLECRAAKARLLGEVLSGLAFHDDESYTLYRDVNVDENVYETVAAAYRDID